MLSFKAVCHVGLRTSSKVGLIYKAMLGTSEKKYLWDVITKSAQNLGKSQGAKSPGYHTRDMVGLHQEAQAKTTEKQTSENLETPR